VHWGKQVRFDKIAEGFGCYGEYVEREEDIGPAIQRAFASGKPGVIHVPIDAEANSTEMPKYEEFRTWYAEGMQ
jgi:acetolactate synthase I/II/III large subunit